MMNSLMGPMLTQYFLIDGICGGFLSRQERLEVPDKLRPIFGVPRGEETDALLRTALDDPFAGIQDLEDYNRFSRTLDYAAAVGQAPELTDGEREVLARKQEAMTIKAELFPRRKNLTADTVATTLRELALSGNVEAMGLLAFMQYHGIGMEPDPAQAMEYVRRCAGWNSLFGNLMGLAWDRGRRSVYSRTLYTITRGTPRQGALGSLIGGKLRVSPEAELLETCFRLGVAKRCRYDCRIAPVVGSRLLSIRDRQALLTTHTPEALAALGLPLGVRTGVRPKFSEKKASDLPLVREGELARIFRGLSPVTAGHPELYRPLLIAGDEDYLSGVYLRALEQGFAGSCPVVRVDAGKLTPRDLMPGRDHFLLRGLTRTENAATVFLIYNCDALPDGAREELQKLLSYESRREFALTTPAVTLDLSGVIPVLLADRVNGTVRALAEDCDAVRAEPLTQEEKHTVTDALFREYRKRFGSSAVLEPGCHEVLEAYSSCQMDRLLESALKRTIYEKRKAVTPEMLRHAAAELNVHKPRREFGFMGGVWNE